MTEENIIRAHDSGRRPFTTPEGYFESFTERLMSRLPEKDAAQPATPLRAKHVGLSPMRRLMRYAAAVIIAAGCIGGGMYILDRNSQAPTVATLADDMVTEDNIDDILDYEMLSNNQIAYYLTEAY